MTQLFVLTLLLLTLAHSAPTTPSTALATAKNGTTTKGDGDPKFFLGGGLGVGIGGGFGRPGFGYGGFGRPGFGYPGYGGGYGRPGFGYPGYGGGWYW